MNTTTAERAEAEDEDVEHGERIGVAETIVDYRETGLGAAKAVAVKVALVCSCGAATCHAIGRFGLPRPLYQAEIAPPSSQYARDLRAGVLKQAGTSAP